MRCRHSRELLRVQACTVQLASEVLVQARQQRGLGITAAAATVEQRCSQVAGMGQRICQRGTLRRLRAGGGCWGGSISGAIGGWVQPCLYVRQGLAPVACQGR